MPTPVIKLSDVTATEKWQQILADLVTDPKELLQLLELDIREFDVDEEVLRTFPLKVPRPYLSRIEKGNWQDPLLRQILPLRDELASPGEFKQDPLREDEFNPLPGLLHKYHGRVLLTVAPHCAIHCRYCFRRHFDYQANSPGRHAWLDVIDYIRQDSSIEEVIFSGGDPLAAGDRQLAWITSQLETIPHLQRLRIHTRIPVMVPQRVTSSLIDWLTRSRLKPVMVVHCNHANEIDSHVADSFNLLATNGVILLNQSVLLKDVNDKSIVLAELSSKLFENNVLPYYLHLLDPVAGVMHFDVAEARGRQIIREMQGNLPGYLVPNLVREQAGEPAKTRIN